MEGKPRSRWFRFRLSTLFVLVAIAAWVMATRPYFLETRGTRFDASTSRIVGFAGRRLNPALLAPALCAAGFIWWRITENSRAKRTNRPH